MFFSSRFVTFHLKRLSLWVCLSFRLRRILLLIVALKSLLASLCLIIGSSVRLLFILPSLELIVDLAGFSGRSICYFGRNLNLFLERHLRVIFALLKWNLVREKFGLSLSVSVLSSCTIVRLRVCCFSMPIRGGSKSRFWLGLVVGDRLLVNITSTKNAGLLVLVHALPCVKVLTL